MEPLQAGFDELERAFGLARFTFARDEPISMNSPQDSLHAPQNLPAAVAHVPESDWQPVSPLSDDNCESLHACITPPLKHPEPSRHNSGLPPTPPTLTNSDVAEAKPDPNMSPMPLFADRVRNALESQMSGTATPNLTSQSPPTPDASPPSQGVLRPQMQSCTESFVTATEGLSANDNISDVDQVGNEQSESEEQTLLGTPKASWTTRSGERNGAVDADLTEESDRGEARAKNYKTESEGEKEKDARVLYGKKRSTTDEKSTSPTRRLALDHRAAYQRLRKPIQPGDPIKPLNAALLYGSLGPRNLVDKTSRGKAEPKREMDTEFLMHAEIVPLDTPELVKPASPAALRDERMTRSPSMPSEKTFKLREFAPSGAPPEPTPPTTAEKASLADNNNVYRMIQEENAQRHSAIGGGSVQALVIPIANSDSKHKLRHAPKRESLRGDVSMASNSKRSSSESGHKLRHMRASITSAEATQNATVAPEPLKLSSRISCFDTGENDFDYWSIVIPEIAGAQPPLREAKIVTPVADQGPGRSRRLRRSLRENDLDRHASTRDSTETRPWTSDGSTAPHPTPSATLRRFSREDRLENNDEVRRTSLGRDSHVVSPTIDAKLDLAAEDLTREGREMRDGTTVAERCASPDRNVYTVTSPGRKSLDPRHLHPTGTLSPGSQWSERADGEVLEARGVEIFPHNNRSLLLVQQPAQIVRPPRLSDLPITLDIDDIAPPVHRPVFEAYVEAPTSTDEIGKPKYVVDSPLTNPRVAPEPPVIKFIPPTPNQELERPLQGPPAGESHPSNSMRRRWSLSHRVRRYSENLIPPLPFSRSGSTRRQAQKRDTAMPDERATHLSSFWQPRGFWEQYDSDSDSSSDMFPLPPGGDTSDIPSHRHLPRSFPLPRHMSVRMPGFRGSGGFLVGNSLGLDRHGTNVRRPYIAKPETPSAEILRRHHHSSRRRTFVLPFSRGTEVEFVGLKGWGRRMGVARRRREERRAEKRREELRGRIGVRMFHDGRCGVP